MKVLFFDLDGTLTDPQEGITNCFRYAFEKMAVPAPPIETLRSFIGPPLKKSFASVLNTEDSDTLAEAVQLYRERFGTVGLFENRVYDGIPEVLAALKSRFRCLLVTAKPTVYAERIVKRFRLDPWLEAIYGSELDGTHTDKRTLIAHVLQAEGVSAGNAIMIGDRDQDMIGARHNRVCAIGALWGYGSEEELRSTGADLLCPLPTDLPDAIDALEKHA